MWIVQYMGSDDNFWRTLVFPKGKEAECLERMNELNEQGCITRCYKRCTTRDIEDVMEVVK